MAISGTIQKTENGIKLAFVAEEYSEQNFSSGGVKLNTFLLAELKKRGWDIDIYCERKNSLNAILEHIYDIDEFTEKNRLKYDFVLSEKAVVESDLTYLHDHTNIYRWKYMTKNDFIYKTFYKEHYRSRLEQDEKRKKILLNTKEIIVSSAVLKKDIMDNYGISEEKIHIITPPVLNFQEIPDNKTKSDKCIFGISATGFERKGGFVLLKAIRKIKNQNKNFKVIFIHNKPNWGIRFLISLYGINKYVEFIDETNNINAFYDSLSFLLVPSLVEPFGMVVTEAMARRTPVIVSSRCGASELIENAKNGYVVDFNKNPVNNLANSIISAMNLSENEYKQLADNAYETVKKKTLENFTDKMVKLLKSLVY